MGRRVGYNPAISSDQTWGDWYNDHRLLLNPLVVGVVVGVAGVLCAWQLPLWPHTAGLTGAATLAILIWTVGLLDSGQRIFYRLITLIGAGWMLILHTPWALRWPLEFAVAWLSITVLAGIGYWTDQREKQKVYIDKDLRSWPALAAKIQLPLVNRTPWQTIAPGSRKMRLWWDRGDYTVAAVMAKKDAIEGALGVALGQMRMEPVKDTRDNSDSSAVDIIVNTDSAARHTPVPFTEPTMQSILDPMHVLDYEDGEKLLIHWYVQNFGGQHVLAAGSTRGGKSGLYQLSFADSIKCQDVVRWGIDAKGGMALKPWAPLFDWLICGAGSDATEEQAWMLARLLAVIQARSEYASKRGWGVWRVSKKHPLMIFYLDEAAEVLGLSIAGLNAADLAGSITRLGAGVGVIAALATQHPTTDAIASTQIQKNILRRFLFRVADSGQQDKIIPGSVGKVDATFPDMPAGKDGAGWCFYSDYGHMRNLPGRVRYVPDEAVWGIITTYFRGAGTLDAVSANVTVGAEQYAARKRWTVADVDPANLVWSDDEDDDEETTPDPLVSHQSEGSREGSEMGSDEGSRPEDVSGSQEGSEMEVDVLPQGVPVSLEELLQPRTPEEAEERARQQAAWQIEWAARRQAAAQWDADNAEWSTERATAAFWATLKAATEAGDGVRTAKLAAECHRSTSWVWGEMAKARQAGVIQPMAPGSKYYRLTPGRKPPTESNAA